ncbi:Aminomethyltransferase [Lentibacillus sp. JNUCC-1]|uniref:glycine cleavage system aminomethyltransferase GcvT n=1 Tax=Lentibacillus sp. JNUCC-1 TaxID=2654513 RepID=UPI0012E7DAC7|nr:glycine cleavage system aminomethyltransferase GcvT [Lentibacillus sp. JNUCC-1]MUV39656.1 Aminomethyltransferase [Lentibacillus sp. JNUCC-1]
MDALKRTPIYPEYGDLGAKTIDFGGWDMPVQFAGIKQEHEATRTKAGLFDVSHMGEIMVKGPESESFLQRILTNDISKMTEGKCLYTFMCYENGGVVDDFLVYKFKEHEYMLVVNAANTEKDVEWLTKQQSAFGADVTIKNVSDYYALLALQGPNAQAILQTITTTQLADIKFFRFDQNVHFDSINSAAIVSRTGYTGEDGFEIYIDQVNGRVLWNLILEAGADYGLEPVGLGARDTLRFEANLPLYGQEISPDITPIEAGLKFAVKVNKDANFIGKDVLRKQVEEGAKRKLVGIEMIDKGIPRHGYEVLSEDKVIGEVTSGTQSPTLKKNIGLALIDAEYADIGAELTVQVRKRRLKAVVIPTPFLKK